MSKKRHTKEARIRAIREHEAGRSQAEICRQLNITAPTFYRWKKQLGMMTNSDAQRLRLLEKDNRELKQMVADLLLEKRVLKVALEKNSKPAGSAGAVAGRPCEDDVLGAACLQDPRAAPEHGSLQRQAA
jgi:putative transposase